MNLIDIRVPDLGCLKAPLLFQSIFFKGLTGPKKETDAVFSVAGPDNQVSIKEPHRMGRSYFIFRFRQVSVNLPGEMIADLAISGLQLVVVFFVAGYIMNRL